MNHQGLDELGNMDDIGRRIAELRKARGWSQRELARRVSAELRSMRVDVPDLNPSAVKYWEDEPAEGRQRQRLRVDEWIALCRVFELDDPLELVVSAEAAMNRTADAVLEARDKSLADITRSVLALIDMERALNFYTADGYGYAKGRRAAQWEKALESMNQLGPFMGDLVLRLYLYLSHVALQLANFERTGEADTSAFTVTSPRVSDDTKRDLAEAFAHSMPTADDVRKAFSKSFGTGYELSRETLRLIEGESK